MYRCAPGFKALTQKNVNVLINNVTRADLRLEVGALTETITVEASAAAASDHEDGCQRQPASAGNREPAALRLPQLSKPGQPGSGRHAGTVSERGDRYSAARLHHQCERPGPRRQQHPRGRRAQILVTMPHHMVYVPPVESIEEVNISTNNFDAEQGMTGGAAVTVTTKSGTNQFHGSAFAFTPTTSCAPIPGTKIARA